MAGQQPTTTEPDPDKKRTRESYDDEAPLMELGEGVDLDEAKKLFQTGEVEVDTSDMGKREKKKPKLFKERKDADGVEDELIQRLEKGGNSSEKKREIKDDNSNTNSKKEDDNDGKTNGDDDGKIVFRKPTAPSTKKQKHAKKESNSKKIKNKSLLSFNDEDE